EVFQIREWQDRLQAKDVSIEKLKKHIENLKGKSDVESAKTVKITNVIPSKVYKLDLPPLCPRLKNNREAHVYYLKFVSNANFKPICVTYNECMFDNVHDSCVADFINDMNVIGKSKPVKAKSGRSNKKEWKPTRKIFSSVGHRLSKLFFGTVRFGNDQIAKIMGYGDYQLGNVTIYRVYYVEGRRHNLFFVGQFWYSQPVS
ncbi:hypothetical protein Tco_0044853, partial [Tanacetum coccineum]